MNYELRSSSSSTNFLELELNSVPFQKELLQPCFYRLFQEGRKIVGAMLQHITYNEWLPVILGPRVLNIFELTLNPNGQYDRHNASVNPSVANAFAAAAFRFGHSLIKSRAGMKILSLS